MNDAVSLYLYLQLVNEYEYTCRVCKLPIAMKYNAMNSFPFLLVCANSAQFKRIHSPFQISNLLSHEYFHIINVLCTLYRRKTKHSSDWKSINNSPSLQYRFIAVFPPVHTPMKNNPPFHRAQEPKEETL